MSRPDTTESFLIVPWETVFFLVYEKLIHNQAKKDFEILLEECSGMFENSPCFRPWEKVLNIYKIGMHAYILK